MTLLRRRLADVRRGVLEMPGGRAHRVVHLAVRSALRARTRLIQHITVGPDSEAAAAAAELAQTMPAGMARLAAAMEYSAKSVDGRLNWGLLAPLLSDTHRVLVVDLFGHGGCGLPTGPRPDALTADRRLLDRFVREVVGEPVILLGHSMGGVLTILQAAAAPQTVRQLVLLSPPVAAYGLSSAASGPAVCPAGRRVPGCRPA